MTRSSCGGYSANAQEGHGGPSNWWGYKGPVIARAIRMIINAIRSPNIFKIYQIIICRTRYTDMI